MLTSGTSMAGSGGAASTEEDNWDVLVLRDPDNIQLELILLKLEADSILPG